jgi:enhancing lycopene biosynthesis protein 2
MKIGVLLSGSGVYDGSEIQEAVLTFLAIAEAGAQYTCFAPDKNQAHVINHLTGEEMPETRNVLVESARIARGEVAPLSEASAANLHALVIPGGFGAAKNLNRWAFEGPEGSIDPEVKRIILDMLAAGKPIAGLCMGPTVIAKALEGSNYHARLTVGTDLEASPYDIKGISEGMHTIGATPVMRSVQEIEIHTELKIVTAPCYMMEANILAVRNNIQQAIQAMIALA